MSRRPNLLVMIMDDQTPNTIRALGNSHISTPHLDALAERGSFLRPYTTVPVCTPGRGEFLTGRTAFRNGCRWFGEPLKREIVTLPMALSQAGYHCCHVGKWHNDGHPRDRGFAETHRVFHDDLIGDYRGQWMKFADGETIVSGHSTELFADAAVRFVESADREKPWFCYLALHSPHDPRTAPAPWNTMYDACPPPLPDNFLPEHPFDNGDMMIRDERLAGFPRRPAEIVRHRKDYYSMISHHDFHLGRVMETLRRTGQEENTIVVFTSDHGLACGCHGLMGKENLYEHSARVPLLIAGPGLPVGQRFDRDCLCGHYDFLPTLLEILELERPETCEGTSYLDVLRGWKTTVRPDICAGYRDCMRLARDGRFKMIYYPHLDRTQLFDIVADPEETNDLLTTWRRQPESRCCPPPAAPGRTFSEPDPNPDPAHDTIFNPLYRPAVPDAEADAAVTRLRGILEKWQREMADPILGQSVGYWQG